MSGHLFNIHTTALGLPVLVAYYTFAIVFFVQFVVVQTVFISTQGEYVLRNCSVLNSVRMRKWKGSPAVYTNTVCCLQWYWAYWVYALVTDILVHIHYCMLWLMSHLTLLTKQQLFFLHVCNGYHHAVLPHRGQAKPHHFSCSSKYCRALHMHILFKGPYHLFLLLMVMTPMRSRH